MDRKNSLHVWRGPRRAYPEGGVIVGPAGALYGTTFAGGLSGGGSVYQLTPGVTGAPWRETLLYSFGSNAADGTNPSASLVSGAGGVLYGTTSAGGDTGNGAVFALSPPTQPGGAWTETILHSFTGLDGSLPLAKLTLDASGNLYGTTYSGGERALGTVFELTPPAVPNGIWTETVIYSFVGGAFGNNPDGGVVFGSNGLYGTSLFGGSGNALGTVFQLTPPTTAGAKWTQNVIHSFFCCTDGANPRADLIVLKGDILFGVTNGGGGSSACHSPQADGCGAVFALEPPTSPGAAWGEKLLHRFTGTDGSFPHTGLVPSGDGVLFGTTSQGGAPAGLGTVFGIVP